MFDWTISCSYNADQKAHFHRIALIRLRQLAHRLGFPRASYDLRSNKAGIAVSGEITLHHERVYIQAAQFFVGGSQGILIRTCRGRRDYRGGVNHFASLVLLDDLPALAARVRAVMTSLPPAGDGEEPGSPAAHQGPGCERQRPDGRK